jgi:hypothetical protein
LKELAYLCKLIRGGSNVNIVFRLAYSFFGQVGLLESKAFLQTQSWSRGIKLVFSTFKIQGIARIMAPPYRIAVSLSFLF